MTIILKIDNNEKINEIKINEKSNILKQLSDIDKSKNINLLYYWIFDDIKLEIYGKVEDDNNCNTKNKHILPNGGISDVLSVSSEDIDIYGNLYVIKYNHEQMSDIDTLDYGEIYNILNLLDYDDNQIDDSKYIIYQEEDESDTNNFILKSDRINNNNMIGDLDYDITEY